MGKHAPSASAPSTSRRQHRVLAGALSRSDGQPLEFYSYGDDEAEKEGARGSPGGLVAKTPSPYWSDQARANRRAFPPRADSKNCRMRTCRHGSYRCGRIYPRPYTADRNGFVLCADCINESILRAEDSLRDQGLLPDRRRSAAGSESAGETSSPTTIAQQALEIQNARLFQSRLKPESETSLKREIERYHEEHPASDAPQMKLDNDLGQSASYGIENLPNGVSTVGGEE